MGLSANFIELNRPLPLFDTSANYGSSTNFYDTPWNIQAVDQALEPAANEHPFIDDIRKAILNYRLQSAAHFQFDIGVHVKRIMPVNTKVEEAALDPSLRIDVELSDFNGRVPATFRPKFRKVRRTSILKPTNKVEVFENGRATSLSNFLTKHFPSFTNHTVPEHTMQSWWQANGKHFDWNGLPTELKEHVVQFCMHAPLAHDEYRTLLTRHKSRFARRPGEKPGREFGIYEIVDQLGNWSSLLGVSHQVRAIALRLCFNGSSELLHSKGFCLFASSYEKFDNAIRRLGRYYQMVELNSLPTDDKTRALAHCYKHYPVIYPHLQQYATFAHGIRKVCLYMDFLSNMHFFKVTVGGFQRHWYTGQMTYEVFAQLPHLKEIEIRLPLQPQHGWKDYPHQRGPQLFYHLPDQACPRSLHQFIYERIAEVLAPYPYVRVKNFGDEHEKGRFYALRHLARQKAKFTANDLTALYAECGGGIQLQEPVEQEVWDNGETEQQPTFQEIVRAEDGAEPFFPPKCRCDVRCNLVYTKKEKHRRRLWG
tara:strand:+ start:26094 stop:27707 length:1614 start_codon:yes stop_codon:yes gene_type:complete